MGASRAAETLCSCHYREMFKPEVSCSRDQEFTDAQLD